MFFTRIGIIIAHLIFWMGTIRVGIGFLGAFGTQDMEENRDFSRRVLGSETTGEAINEGMLFILAGVAFGVICEISSRRAKSEEDT